MYKNRGKVCLLTFYYFRAVDAFSKKLTFLQDLFDVGENVPQKVCIFERFFHDFQVLYLQLYSSGSQSPCRVPRRDLIFDFISGDFNFQ